MSVLKPTIVAMSAYSPPLEGRDHKQDTLLDFNERTQPLTALIKNTLVEFITQEDRLHLYPAYGDITRKLADYAGVESNQVMITNGSDQGIDLLFRSVARTAKPEAIIPGPTFAMYHQCARVEGMTIIEPEYSLESGYPIDDVIGAITGDTALIVVSNPNNPCGTIVSISAIERLAKAAPQAAILVDECYFEYSGVSASVLIALYSNVFITRTFSKTWGMPSLRFGYLLAQESNINALLNVRGPYDINQLAVVAAQAALANPEYTDNYVAEVMEQAKPLFEAWLKANNIVFWPSHANYLWVFPTKPADLNDYLLDNHYRVRPKLFQQQMGLRITVGTMEQTERLIELLDAYLKDANEGDVAK